MSGPSVHTLTLAGNNRSQYGTQDFDITQEFGRQGATGTINLWDEHLTAGTLNVVPKGLDSILLQGSNGTGTVNIFGGVVSKPKLQWMGPNSNNWALTCRDYTYYADMSIVAGTFIGQTADAIIRSLVAQANCGLTANNVIPGPVIPRVQIKYQPLSTAITKVSLLASGAIFDSAAVTGVAISVAGKKAAEYAWYVDESLDIHWFNAMNASDSGIVFTDDLTTSGFDANKGGITLLGTVDRESLTYEWDGNNLRTATLVRGGRFSGGQTDHFVANGVQASWPLTFDLDPTVTTSLTLTVGILPKTVTAIDATQIATAQITTQYVVVQQPSGQWFLVVGTDGTPAAGTQIIFTYTYGGTIIARADDFAEQATFGGANRGIFENVINDSSLLSFATAHQRAQSELQQYSNLQERVVFKTTEDWPGHIRGGQTFIFSSQVIPDASRNYALGLRARYLAERVQIRCMPGQYRVYTITGTRIS